MDRIIEEALRQLKSGVEELTQSIGGSGISPQNLSRFERSLQGKLGEFARGIEKAVLEAADVEKPALVNCLQVRKVRSDDETVGYTRTGGKDRSDHSGGRPGAGDVGRHGRSAREFAQCR